MFDFQITYNEQAIRLIPSLNGGLYKFDGESVEPFPITAESLLSTTVKLTDQSIITGGNEVRTYGINPTSGKVINIKNIAGVVSHWRMRNKCIVSIKGLKADG